MPIIPQRNESVRLNPTMDIEANNARKVGIQAAETTATLGAGMQNLAETAYAYKQEKEKTDKARNQYGARVTSAEAQLASKKYADENASPDGSDYVDLEKKKYAELRKDYFKDVDDSEGSFSTLWDMDRAQQLPKVYSTGRAKQVAHMEIDYQDSINKASALVANDPDSYDKWQQGLTTLTTDGLGLMDPSDQKKLIEQANKDLSTSAVNGYIQKKEFDKAHEFVNKKQAFFGAEAAQTLRDRIDTKKLGLLNMNAKLETIEDKNIREQEKEERDQEFDNMNVAINELSGLPNIPDQQVAEVQNELDERLASGRLDRPQYNFLNNRLYYTKNPRGDDQPSFVFKKIHRKVLDGKSKQEVKKEVLQEYDNGNINTAQADRLMKLAKDDSKLTPKQKQQLKISNNRLKAYLPNLHTNDDEDKVLVTVTEARDRYMEEGMDADEAAKKALKDYKLDKPPTIPGLSKEVQEDAKLLRTKGVADLKAWYRANKAKKGTDAEYERRTNLLVRRLEIMRYTNDGDDNE